MSVPSGPPVLTPREDAGDEEEEDEEEDDEERGGERERDVVFGLGREAAATTLAVTWLRFTMQLRQKL